MTDTKIFASGDLNEYKIADLISRGAAIDSFGVGTELATSYDAPALSGVYKLAAIEENGHMSMRIKLSHERATYPGPKQVWRFSDEAGKYAHDSIALPDEASPGSGDGSTHSCSPLLELVMERGCVIERTESKSEGIANTMKTARWTTLNDARERARRELERLPAELLLLDSEAGYSVGFSERLVEERKKLERTHAS
jgi:nicotinate phosphoribosyltransferase